MVSQDSPVLAPASISVRIQIPPGLPKRLPDGSIVDLLDIFDTVFFGEGKEPQREQVFERHQTIFGGSVLAGVRIERRHRIAHGNKLILYVLQRRRRRWRLAGTFPFGDFHAGQIPTSLPSAFGRDIRPVFHLAFGIDRASALCPAGRLGAVVLVDPEVLGIAAGTLARHLAEARGSRFNPPLIDPCK